MAAQIFPYGTALTVVWHLSKPDGTDFDITGYTYRVYYRTGNKETEVNGTHLTASGNTLSIVIPATEPSAPGEYALRLVLYQNNRLFCTLNYNAAFVLSRRLAQDLAMQTQQEEVQIVHLYTVAEFYLFTPIIPTVGSDGYWYVNGTKVTDGHGEFVPSSHTMEYDAQTNYIIIDRDRVDSQGHSIAQTITSLADALSTAAEDHETAQEDHSTAAGDHQTAAADHSTATWDHQAIVDMIDLYEPITINGDVTNAPDEEDITSDENDLLKFKDRGVIYGMGYCILRRNKTFAEQVTKINTIYEIRYDFDLDGATVTIPEGAYLKFVGGSLNNGQLEINDNVTIEGGSFTTDVYPTIIGDGVSNVTIKDCVFVGALEDGIESINDYSVTGEWGCQHMISITDGTDCEFSNLSFSKIQGGLILTNCKSITAVDFDMVGLLGEDLSIRGGSGSGGVNYHNVIEGSVYGGTFRNIHTKYTGECVVFGTASQDLVIDGCTGEYCHDTFVYLSSGDNCVVSNCILNYGAGTGIKLRGSHNSAIGNVIKNIQIPGYALSITGYGHTDPLMASEWGDVDAVDSKFIGNSVIDCWGGISVWSKDNGGRPVYGCVVADNYVQQHAETPSGYYALAVGGYNHVVHNNVLRGPNEVVSLGGEDNIFKGSSFMYNSVFSTADYRSMYVQYSANSKISHNKVNARIDVRNVTNTEFIRNIDIDGQITYYQGGGYTRENNVFEVVNSSDTAFNANTVLAGNPLLILHEQSFFNTYGPSTSRPTARLRVGTPFYDTTINRQLYWNGTAWVDDSGYGAVPSFGGTFPETNVLGTPFFDTIQRRPAYRFDSSSSPNWSDADGYTFGLKHGSTANRPTLKTIDKGYCYFDEDLGKMICYNGSAWINLDGTALA